MYKKYEITHKGIDLIIETYPNQTHRKEINKIYISNKTIQMFIHKNYKTNKIIYSSIKNNKISIPLRNELEMTDYLDILSNFCKLD